MKNYLKNDLTEAIRIHSSLKHMWEILKKHKENGLSKEDAYEILQELRDEFKNKEEDEDRVLELMDFVVGYCSPSMRLY